MTLGSGITTTPINLATDLQDENGNAVALTQGQDYTVQNLGDATIFLFEAASAPGSGAFWAEIRGHRTKGITYDGVAIWARVGSDPTRVSVNEA